MSKIQLVLLLSTLSLLFLYLKFFKSRIFNALFFFCFFVIGMVFVLHPDYAQSIANYLGVGRGVDVVIYFLLVLFFFLFIVLFYKTRLLGKTIIELVRNRAIENASRLGNANKQ